MIEMGINTNIMLQVLSGQKTVEGRLRTGKFITIRKGDIINLREDVWQDDRIVKSVPNRARVVVTSVAYFDSFADMLAKIPLQTVLPEAKSVGEALNTYRQFYTAAQEAELGVVAISFSLPA